MRWLLFLLAILALATGVWALQRPLQNGQDPMGAALLHAAYGGL